MFLPDGVNRLYARHRDTLTSLVQLTDALNSRFYDMTQAVHCMALAAMSGEAMVMIGPPGTAKSRLVRAFCNLTGLLDGSHLTGHPGADNSPQNDEAYFEYLLTEFTEPSELFGFFDMDRFQKGEGMFRMEEGMLQRAEVVFLDEVFNASSSILNALLAIMNEGIFHDRGVPKPTALQLLFSATNHPPTDPTLAAFFDRFLLRCWMKNVDAQTPKVTQLLQAGWSETHATKTADPDNNPFAGLLDGLEALRDDVDRMTADGQLAIDPASPLIALLVDMTKMLEHRELLAMSNRRLIKLSGIMLFNALLRAARDDAPEATIERQDLTVVTRFSVNKPDPRGVEDIEQSIQAK